METLNGCVYVSLLSKIKETEDLQEACQQLGDMSGKNKLQRKIESELRFLRALSCKPEKLKEVHIRSSNLLHLSAIVRCCLQMLSVVNILEPFSYKETVQLSNDTRTVDKRLIVDIVSDRGKTWVKVVARNPLALMQSSLGEGKFGRRSIIEQVEDMKKCAKENLFIYTCPKIAVWFSSGVTHDLQARLVNMGVTVLDATVDDADDFQVDDSMEMLENLSDGCCNDLSEQSNSQQSQFNYCETQLNCLVQEKGAENSNETLNDSDIINLNKHLNLHSIPIEAIFNLDVSTMLAQVSNITNGFASFQFQEQILTDQATRESQFPVRKVLDLIFKGHKLLCCQTAFRDFTKIISTVGGAQEKMRAATMLNGISIVPDSPSEKALALLSSSKVRDRSRVIFGTGDNLEAITVTANLGFLRAAQSQGIKFAAFVHESRALTEQKEKTALSVTGHLTQ